MQSCNYNLKIPDLPTVALKTEMEELIINEESDKLKETEESKPKKLVAIKYRTLVLESTIKIVKEGRWKREACGGNIVWPHQ